MASSSAKSLRPSIAIVPALQSVTARSSALASACSAMRASVPSGARIRRPYSSAGSSGRKSQHRGRGFALAPGPDEPFQGLGADQRRVGVDHDHVAPEIPEQRAGLRHRVGGAERLVLHHAGGRAVAALQAARRGLEIGPDHQHRQLGRERTDVRQHVLHHRPPGERMQHLVQGRAHARPLARREDDAGEPAHPPLRGALRARRRRVRWETACLTPDVSFVQGYPPPDGWGTMRRPPS